MVNGADKLTRKHCFYGGNKILPIRQKKDYKKKDEKVVGLYTDVIRGIREIKNLNLKSVVLRDVNQKQAETIISAIMGGLYVLG